MADRDSGPSDWIKETLKLPGMGSKEWLEWWANEREMHIANEMRNMRFTHKDEKSGRHVTLVPCDKDGKLYKDYHSVEY